MMSKLSSETVENVFLKCLFQDGEDTTNAVMVDGVVRNYGFHPERLEQERGTIARLLDELQDEFKDSVGGGFTFLSACNDKHGEQWTGLHSIMEQLFALGMGLNLAAYVLPRDLWGVLPGGMPYLKVRDRSEEWLAALASQESQEGAR